MHYGSCWTMDVIVVKMWTRMRKTDSLSAEVAVSFDLVWLFERFLLYLMTHCPSLSSLCLRLSGLKPY